MKNLILIYVLSLTSCSIFLPTNKIDYSESYVTGVGTERLSSEAIKNNLIRNISMAGGNYSIRAFPITKAYINAIINEQTMLKALRNKEAANLKSNLYSKYIEGKACIKTQVNIKEFERVRSIENWNLTLIDSNNIAYKLSWLPENKNKLLPPSSVVSIRKSYHGDEKMWTFIAEACADADVEMKKGFKVVFKPSFVQWPFPDETEYEWSFDYTEIIDGKKVEVKKKEKKKQGYRGW